MDIPAALHLSLSLNNLLIPTILEMEPRRSKRLAARATHNGSPQNPTGRISKRKKTAKSRPGARLNSKRRKTPDCHTAGQPRALLVELPTELLDFISRAVLEKVVGGKRFPDHPQDLISFGQTCRRLFRVTQHALYQKIIAGHTRYGTARRINLGKLVPTPEFSCCAS